MGRMARRRVSRLVTGMLGGDMLFLLRPSSRARIAGCRGNRKREVFMRNLILTTSLIFVGGLALAQTAATNAAAPAHSPTGVSVAPGAPVPPPPAPMAPNVNGMHSQQEIFMALSKAQQDLQPYRQTLEQDPEFRALREKVMTAQKQYMEMQKQLEDLADSKLSVDPNVAPLIEKYRELRKKAQELMRGTPQPGGMPPNIMPPRSMGQRPAPQALPVPAAAPTAAPVSATTPVAGAPASDK